MARPKKNANTKDPLALFQSRNEKFSVDLARLQKNFEDALAKLRRFIDAQKAEAVKASLKKSKAK